MSQPEDTPSVKSTPTKKPSKLPPAPTAGAGVNLAIAHIVLSAIADRMRGQVDAGLAKADAQKRKSGTRDAVDGRTLLTSIGLYGATRLATRSRAGLGLVAGGLIAKSLYERGKAVRKTREER